MKIDLSGKIALVTGGGRGIGRACCTALAEAGASVAINYSRSAEAAEEVRAEIEAAGGQARTYQADVSSFEDVTAMFERVKEDFGTLDILVNNAGVIHDTLLLTMKPDGLAQGARREPGRRISLHEGGRRDHAQKTLGQGDQHLLRSPGSWAGPGRRTTPPPRRASSPSCAPARRRWESGASSSTPSCQA